MPAKRVSILPKILLALGFTALFFIIKEQSKIKEFGLFNLEKARIVSSQPQRRRPVSLLKKETELKLYIGEPFRDFTQKDWDGFWELIYGVFPEEAPLKQRLPKKMVQLTFDAIAFELMSRYPEPFAYFKEEHWKILFGVIQEK